MSSQEISLSVVPPKSKGSLEQQPPHSPSQYHSTTVQSGPPNGTTHVRVKTTQTGLLTTNEQPPTNNAKQKKDAETRKEWFKEMRGGIMVVAVLVASITYTTGLSPPGGFWQDDLNGHRAGTAILRDRFPNRYTTFFYANATAFMASLVIIVLLMNENFYYNPPKIVMLEISMVLDVVSLMIAYAAGCARSFSTSIYVIVLAVAVLLFVVYSAQFLPHICAFCKKQAPWMESVVGRDLIVEPERERHEMTHSLSI